MIESTTAIMGLIAVVVGVVSDCDEGSVQYIHSEYVYEICSGISRVIMPYVKLAYIIVRPSMSPLLNRQVVSIYIMRRALSYSIGSNAQTVASSVNAIQITIFNIIYSYIATALTDRENHRTDTEYEDSMISKLFLFQVTTCTLFF